MTQVFLEYYIFKSLISCYRNVFFLLFLKTKKICRNHLQEVNRLLPIYMINIRKVNYLFLNKNLDFWVMICLLNSFLSFLYLLQSKNIFFKYFRSDDPRVVMCYFEGWAVYRNGDGEESRKSFLVALFPPPPLSLVATLF